MKSAQSNKLCYCNSIFNALPAFSTMPEALCCRIEKTELANDVQFILVQSNNSQQHFIMTIASDTVLQKSSK